MSQHYPDNKYLLYNPKESKNNLFLNSFDNVTEKRPKNKRDTFFYNLWRQKNVCKDLLHDQVDIFHGLTGEIPLGIRKTGIPVVVTIHDLIFLRFPKFYSFIDYKIHKYKAQYAVNNADMVVAVSEQTKQDIIDFFGIDAEKIRVVYQGCQDVFRTSFSIQERKKLLERFRLPEAYILNVGTIEQRKNVMLAVKAIKEVNIHLVVVGAKTAYYNDVKAYIQSHGLENKVTFLTGVSSKELAALYQSAQMFVYPSLFEGFGIPIIEALYSGIPVITSKGGCFKEAGGPASVYVDPSNEIELKEAIVNILEDEQLKQDMIVQGKQYVERFNPRYIADSFEKIYSELNKNLY